MFAGGGGVGGGLGEVVEGGLGFVGEGGEEGEGWIGGWKGSWEGGQLENRGGSRNLGRGRGRGSWGGDRDSLGSFPFSFPGLNCDFAWVGVEVWTIWI